MKTLVSFEFTDQSASIELYVGFLPCVGDFIHVKDPDEKAFQGKVTKILRQYASNGPMVAIVDIERCD